VPAKVSQVTKKKRVFSPFKHHSAARHTQPIIIFTIHTCCLKSVDHGYDDDDGGLKAHENSYRLPTTTTRSRAINKNELEL
jgi:hypothetical protein